MQDTLAPKASAAVATGRMEVVTFTLGNEEYAIEIQRVQELRSYEAVTRIANAPEYMKGIMNLRGIIVPVIDMRLRFNAGPPRYDDFTVVIVLNIRGRVVGMVVDTVSDVIALAAEQIRPAPPMGSAVDTEYLIGLGTLDERMLILIDIDKLMSSDEIGMVENVADAA